MSWSPGSGYPSAVDGRNRLNAKSEPFPSELSRSLNPAGFEERCPGKVITVSVFGSQKVSLSRAWVCLSEVSTVF